MDKKAEMTMKESNNLCDMWIRDEIAYQSNKIRALKEAYDSLKNKDTDYAEGIKRMKNLRDKLIKVLYGGGE